MLQNVDKQKVITAIVFSKTWSTYPIRNNAFLLMKLVHK